MMEIYILSMLSFAICVYAYITGVKHGLSVSKARVPTPIKDAVVGLKTAITPTVEQEPDLMTKLMSYDYETALQSVKKEQLEAKR